MPESALTYFWLCLSALAAGVVNAVAGGGTLLTFPALISAGGLSEVAANGTSTVALVPGSLAGAWGYRRECAELPRWALLLMLPSLVGGALGTYLVIAFPESYFKALVPWLILTAAVLFLLQPTLTRLTGVGAAHAPATATTRAAVVVFQFLVAVYGGYFGAGIGILMITSLSLMGLGDLRHVNALKTLLAAFINGVSIVMWVIDGRVNWNYALSMAAAAVVGGLVGAHFGRKLPRAVVRGIVIAIGFGVAGYYLARQFGVVT